MIPFLALGSISAINAASVLPACTAGTLSSYITQTGFPPNTGGCAIGILDYYNFSYHPDTAAAPASSSIEVTPTASGFSFGPVSAAPGTTVQFEIDYQIVIDPAPVLTGGDLNLDPPTGSVVVTEYFCNDNSYVYTGSCVGNSSPPTLTVGTPGTGFPSSASITFANPATVSQQVGILFTLTGGAAGASFDGLDAASVVLVPEPAAAAGLFAGLLALGGGYKLRKRRNR